MPKDLTEHILLHLSDQGPDDKAPLSELCEAISASKKDVRETLDKLEHGGFVEITGISRYAVLCQITYDGKQIVKEFTSPPSPAVSQAESEVETTEIWNPDRLNPQHLHIVQRENLINQVIKILENPNDYRIVFLYGQPQVGKTFVLRKLQEKLQQRYVPIYIHVNGWSSTGNKSNFLYELASSILIEVESSIPDLEIKPFEQVSEIEATAKFSRFMYTLSRSLGGENRPFLLMFDELEYLAREETDERIFEYLLGLIERYSQQEAGFIFAGSGDMFDLLKHSALSKILARGSDVCVDCFIEETVRELITVLTAPYFTFNSEALDRMVYLTDGHPSVLKKVIIDIVDQYGREKWRNKVISEHDINEALKDIITGLSPRLIDIWHRLSSSEKNILQQIARSNKTSFYPHEFSAERRYHTDKYLKRLVDRQILSYISSDSQYIVRLGLLVDLISHGILSLNE